MNCDNQNKIAYIFGGANSDGPLNDIWKLDLQTNTFTKL